MKKVAVIGAGIVGSTAAYYLSKEKDMLVTVFDQGVGQATKAAAGIICPWFSKRRNKAWYRLARLGADFYQTLVADLQADAYEADFYDQAGVFLLKKNEDKLKELYHIGKERKKEAALIGQLQIRKRSELDEDLADLTGFTSLLYASGAARVDGAKLTQTLLEASQAELISKEVLLGVRADSCYDVDGQTFDAVLLACGAWLPQILEPLGYKADVRPQKGQLRDFFFKDLKTEHYPVIMPEGEVDIIPFVGGKVSIGSTHENNQGFDLKIDSDRLDALEKEAQAYLPKLKAAVSTGTRVGIRAYTSDFSPFFGEVSGLPNVYAASGLGSSGLTTGPLIANQLVKMLTGKSLDLPAGDYSPDKYVIKGG